MHHFAKLVVVSKLTNIRPTITIDEVLSIQDCTHTEVNSTFDCPHSQWVGVICSDTEVVFPPPFVNLTMLTHDHAGSVMANVQSKGLGMVSDYGWGMEEANVACR